MHYKYMILNGFQKYLSSRHNKNIAGQEYIYIKETMYNLKEHSQMIHIIHIS